MRFHLQTFGCKSNQYESQAIREQLAAAGFAEVPAETADVFVINTCGVTGRAGASCRNAIRRALRANPRLAVVVTGCAVDLEEGWLPELADGGMLVPNTKKHALAAMIGGWLAKRGDAVPPPDDRFGMAISSFAGHTRAFVKIQDGCDNHCSYCAVPRARGNPISRPPEEILAEAARLIANGHGEIALTGINIGVYRHGDLDFAALVEELASLTGLVRLRLGSVEPPQVTDRLLAVMRDNEAVCPHLHLPLQSGDDGILRAMRRRYDAAFFLGRVAAAKKFLVQPAITTDVIVGFPGEDATAFANTARVCVEAGFSRLHVFPFSPRPGTPAAAMPDRPPDAVTGERRNELIRLGGELAAAYAAACVGLREQVIIETGGDSGLCGRYVRTRLPGAALSSGTAVRVKITGTDAEGLVAGPAGGAA